MSKVFDKLLARLRIDPAIPPDPATWERLLGKIHEAYEAWDQDRYLLERAMEVSSQELRELMEEVQSRNTELQHEVTEHSRTADQLRYSATHDLLTGLASRAMLIELLTQSLQAEPVGKPGYAALFLDLDGFKRINDSLGHEAGDLVLVGVADRLRETCQRFAPNKPSIARIGGDEFVILLRRVDDRADAAACAGALCAAVCEPMAVNDRSVSVGASIGIALGDPRYDSANEVLRDADIAMYHAKSLGKARFAHFDRAMHDEMVERLATEESIRDSIDRDRFVAFYQPKVNLNHGDIVGFEALVRWDHPEHGVLSPASFLSVADETGLIVPLGDAVLRRVCRDLRGWLAGHPDELRGVTVAFNLSRRQITAPDAVDRFLGILAEERVDPTRIIVELTEHSVAADVQGVGKALARLRGSGVRVHMDDFGTGESSLAALHNLPLDAVKIDRQFIAKARGNRELTAVVSAIVTLAHNLGLTVVGEGVERLEQIAQLQACECDEGQGYYFSRPMPPDEALDSLVFQVRRWTFQHHHHAA